MATLDDICSVTSAFKEATKHLMDLANPFLFLEIKKAFDCMEPLAGEIDEFVKVISALKLPDDTRTFLENLIKETKETENLPCLKEALSEIVSALSQREILIWDDLGYFLEVPAINKFSNNNLKKVMCQVNQKNEENLSDLLKEILGDAGIKEVNDSLQDTEYENMETLIGEVILHIPKKKEGILTYWDRPNTFFEKKTIYLKDPVSFQSHSGNITTCYKDNKSFIFQLHDQSEIRISSRHIVTLKEKWKYKFWDLVCQSMLQKGTRFELTYQGGTSRIPPGKYFLFSVEERSDFVEKVKHAAGYKPVSYTDICIKNIEEPSKKYIISVQHYKNDDHVQKVTLKIISTQEVPSNNYISSENIPVIENTKKYGITNEEFCNAYYVLITCTVEMKGIDLNNIDKQVTIKDERDENEERRIHLEEIEEQIAGLRENLLSADNCKLLDLLIASLIDRKLADIDVEILNPDNMLFLNQLKDISIDYVKKLEINRPPSEILKALVFDANYANMVKKEKCREVARTMELLRDCEKQIEGIESRDAIFFIGNTGSGKSTAISYFMGAKMIDFFNSVGDKVVKIEDGQESKFPRIGQALGESETLYTSGYPTLIENVSLVDCPGFNDTRGSDHEICANMSIDQAVERSGRLKAIVVIIPVQSFLTDRANGVIDLVETVRSRFPFAFNIRCSENSKVFVLITKKSQSQSEAANLLESGNRYEVLLKEAREALGRSDSTESCSSKQNGMKMRASIWEAFVHMHSNGKIDFVYTSNRRLKRRLIDKYVAEGCVDKSAYIKAMQGLDMKRKFGKDVEMASDTWSKHIITRHQEDLPKAIDDKNQEIKFRKDKLTALKDESDKIKECIESRCLTLETAEKAKNEASVEGIKFPHDMARKIHEMKDTQLSVINVELKELDASRKECTGEIEKLESKIKRNEQGMELIGKNITNLLNEISELSRGTYKDDLWTIDYRGKEETDMGLRTFINNTIRNERFLAGEKWRDEDFFKNEKTCLCKNYEGPLAHEALIERKYCIVPKDKSLRVVFQRQCKWNQYEATLEGENFEVDLGMIADPTGKSVQYGFKTIWTKGGKMPWINISHTIPNSEYNSSTIVNKNAEIGVGNAKKAELLSTLSGTAAVVGQRIELSNLKQNLLNFTEKKNSLEKAKQKIEQNIEQKVLDEIILNLNDTINRYKLRERELPKVIFKIENEVLALKKECESLLWTKKRLAIIIYHNRNVVELLRSFAERVVQGAAEIEDRSDITNSCLSFIDAYNKHKDSLFKNCQEDLGFP